MSNNSISPAQQFSARLLEALDNLLANPTDVDYQADVQTLVLERPRTVRSAINALLYKSKMQSYNRR